MNAEDSLTERRLEVVREHMLSENEHRFDDTLATFDHPRYQGVAFPTTTAPYLSRDTGLFFRSYDEFARVFEQWETERETFRPREWVLKNMSDEVCARRLCKLAEVDV